MTGATVASLRATVASNAMRSSRAFHDGIIGGGHSPLHNHPLGHIPPASLTGFGGYHATTILSVRKGNKVVSAPY